MRISRQNQQLFFTVVLCLVLGVIISHLIQQGAEALGEKNHVLLLSERLAQCRTREQYLALLEKEYPPHSRLWQSPALKATDTGAAVLATLERARGGHLRVVVALAEPQQMLERNACVCVPAALVDEHGRSYRLEDIRLNARQDDIVFEYYYRDEPAGGGKRTGRFHFFIGRRFGDLSLNETQ